MEENIVIMNPFNSTFLCSTSLMHTWVCPVGGSNAFKVRLNRMFSVFDKEWWMQQLLHITYVYRLILNFLWFYDKVYTHLGYFYSGNVSYLLKASHLDFFFFFSPGMMKTTKMRILLLRFFYYYLFSPFFHSVTLNSV